MAPMSPVEYIQPGPGRGTRASRGRNHDVEAARTRAVESAVRPPAHCVALVVTAGLAAVGSTASARRADDPKPPARRPFATVLEQVVNGDLVMAGNSNLLSAGGWREGAVTIADVDGESREMCIIRGLGFPRACADNSSSAQLDIPRGAKVIEARLYVQTTVATDVGPLRVQLDGPDEPFRYTELGGATLGVREALRGGRRPARWRAAAAGGVGRHGLRGRPRPPATTPLPTSSPSGPRRTCRMPRGRSSRPTSSMRAAARSSATCRSRRSSGSPPRRVLARRIRLRHRRCRRCARQRVRDPDDGPGLRQELPRRRPQPER